MHAVPIQHDYIVRMCAHCVCAGCECICGCAAMSGRKWPSSDSIAQRLPLTHVKCCANGAGPRIQSSPASVLKSAWDEHSGTELPFDMVGPAHQQSL